MQAAVSRGVVGPTHTMLRLQRCQDRHRMPPQEKETGRGGCSS